MNAILDNQVSDLVKINPRISTVFIELGIDFCCNGTRLLRDVINSQHLNAQELLKEITPLIENKNAKSIDYSHYSLSKLVNVIIN